MYCSTCGARVAEGRTNCQSCGALVPRMSAPAALPQAPASISPSSMAMNAMYGAPSVCPRCGFRGHGATYFSRGGHVAGLVLLALVTAWPFMGAGGILYYLLRHDHRICPRCGAGWGKDNTYAFPLPPGGAATGALAMPPMRLTGPDPLAGSGGNGKRVGSWMLFVLAAILMMVGVAEFAPAILMGLMAGGGGWLLHRGAREDRERRREALLQSLQLPVLQLAGKKAGRLTVTDVATELGWPMNRAEKVLNSLEDGMRVMSDITDEGVIVYDFVEIRAAQLPAMPPPPSRTLPTQGPGPAPSALSA